jgi:dTDP-4-dehydrorhamnose 3,5-epimerase
VLNRFTVTDLPLSGLKLVEHQRLGDERGFLSRLFCREELRTAGWNKLIAQINHTHTAKCGTVRGMHFQYPPYAEMKLVSCIRGEVWDVAIDVRVGSETFLRWHAERLSAENRRALLLPEGFAHGFQTMTDDAELVYCHSAAYAAQYEAGLNARDHKLAIAWPLQISDMSRRDRELPLLNNQFAGVAL